jgi:hypothetical protein
LDLNRWLTMSRFPVFYCAMPDVDVSDSIPPLDATDAFEAEQLVQQRYPGAITASLSPCITDQDEIRRLFMDWLAKV